MNHLVDIPRPFITRKLQIYIDAAFLGCARSVHSCYVPHNQITAWISEGQRKAIAKVETKPTWSQDVACTAKAHVIHQIQTWIEEFNVVPTPDRHSLDSATGHGKELIISTCYTRDEMLSDEVLGVIFEEHTKLEWRGPMVDGQWNI